MGHWSRDLGVLDLPQAVHRLTGQPAKLFGIQNRGLLREGYAADLMLFDPKTVARGPKRRAHDLPAGAARLTTSRSACTASGSTAPRSPTEGLLRRQDGAAGRGDPPVRRLNSPVTFRTTDIWSSHERRSLVSLRGRR